MIPAPIITKDNASLILEVQKHDIIYITKMPFKAGQYFTASLVHTDVDWFCL